MSAGSEKSSETVEEDSASPCPDIATESTANPAMHNSSTSSGRHMNVYTPFSAMSSPDQPALVTSTPHHSPSDKISPLPSDVCGEEKRRNDKPAKPVSSKSPNNRSQRSVRPFFCCGSEQSLISLIDGIELKESSVGQIGDLKVTHDLPCSSDEEEVSSALISPVMRKTSSDSAFMGRAGVDILQTPTNRRKKKDKKHVSKKKFWSLRFRSRWQSRWRVTQSQRVSGMRESSLHSFRSGCSASSFAMAGPSTFGGMSPHQGQVRISSAVSSSSPMLPHIADLDRLYPTESIDHVRLRNRAEEMAFGIEIDPNNVLSRTLQPNLGVSDSMIDLLRRQNRLSSVSANMVPFAPESPPPIEDYPDFLINSLMLQWQHGARASHASPDGNASANNSLLRNMPPQIHTQVDFIHCLVPKLAQITACSFYWGVMDRYEAERLLDNKPEGSFLLRDSAQDEFVFSVSFRRYNRSLHARVEQWNHRFSFDAHDPAVFSAPSVCELMEHYKDSSLCMFFEPMLTRPLHRNFPFSLQHLTRAAICDQVSYDNVRLLPLPNSLKQFLQTYHYKQKVRVRHFDGSDSEISYCDPAVVR